jgi:hypothetical protein
VSAPDPRIDATAAVPIDVASKLTMGAAERAKRTRRQAQRELQRLRIWWDRQQLNPEQVMQLIVLAFYGLITLVDAWAHRGGK